MENMGLPLNQSTDSHCWCGIIFVIDLGDNDLKQKGLSTELLSTVDLLCLLVHVNVGDWSTNWKDSNQQFYIQLRVN